MAESKNFAEETSVVPAAGLSDLVRLGTASEAQLGVQLRAVKLGIAAGACSLVQSLQADSREAMSLMRRLDASYRELLEEELHSMNRSACAEEYERLMDRQFKLAALMVKMAQGRDLFPEDSLSSSDKRVLHLIRAIEESGRMEELLQVVEEKFGESQSFEPAVVEDVPQYDDPYKSVEAVQPKTPSRGKKAAAAAAPAAAPVVEGFGGTAVPDEFEDM